MEDFTHLIHDEFNNSNTELFLYSPKPLWILTPYCESLYSYSCRLASIHNVTKTNLLDALKLTLPMEKQANQYYNMFSGFNGMKVRTQKLVYALELLTKRNNLKYMTTLPLRGMFNERTMFKHNLSWCPRCFYNWRENGNTLYLPLLWSLRFIDICTIHKNFLIDKCPYCNSCFPVTRFHTIGYCPRCTKWLGSNSEGEQIMKFDLQKHVKLGHTVGSLLANLDKITKTEYLNPLFDIRILSFPSLVSKIPFLDQI